MADDDRETKHNILLRLPLWGCWFNFPEKPTLLESALQEKLSSHLAQVYSKHIDEFNPILTKQKAKLIKMKPSQSFKPFERCEYKIVDRPAIQIFKQPEENVTRIMKMLKKSSKITSVKKRNLKTNKLSNLYFDPDGDSMKRYRELYTFKNSPGIRTVTNIQEAVQIYNNILQKARAKKVYLGRRKKRREERLLLESQVSNIIDGFPPSNLHKDRNPQTKDFFDRSSITKHSSDEGSLTMQKKWQKSMYPSKDFLERNKLRKSKVKTYDQCDDLTKAISLTKLPFLPSQEFLNRNMPKKSSDDVEFFNVEYLLRVKTPNSKKLLPAPVVKIGFQDDFILTNSRLDSYSQKPRKKDVFLKSKNMCRDLFLSEIKRYDNYVMDKEEHDSTTYDEQIKSFQKIRRSNRQIISEKYLEYVDGSMATNKSSNCEGSSSVSVVNVGFQYRRNPFDSEVCLAREKDKQTYQFGSLFTTEKIPKEDNWDCFSMKRESPLHKSRNKVSESLQNISEFEKEEIKIPNSSIFSKHCYLDKMDHQAQWKRMQMSLEVLKEIKYDRKSFSSNLKGKLGTQARLTLPDKFRLPLNK